MKDAGRRLLIINFAGLGNGIWIIPILRRLDAAAGIEMYFHISSPIFSARLVMDWLGLRKFAGVVPSAWRRFDRQDWGDILAFLETERIDLVVNLRNEGPFRDIGYFEFKKRFANPGLEFWNLDYDESVNRVQPRSLLADQVNLFAKRGVDVRPQNRTWMRAFVQRSAREVVRLEAIGFYTGASQRVKRWPVLNWIQLGKDLVRTTGKKLIVYAGQTEEELSDAKEIVGAIRGVADGCCRLFAGETFERLSEHMAALDLLISNDTFSVHLASSLGLPVIGLYFSTDASIWGGVSADFLGLQSRTGLVCPVFKPDAGNCTAFYGGCPGPCKDDVTPQAVLAAACKILERAEPLEHFDYSACSASEGGQPQWLRR